MSPRDAIDGSEPDGADQTAIHDAPIDDDSH